MKNLKVDLHLHPRKQGHPVVVYKLRSLETDRPREPKIAFHRVELPLFIASHSLCAADYYR